MSHLPCIEIEPRQQADAAVIWLHGLGADGHDFEPIVPELHLPAGYNVRFIFPNAPSIPVTINGGIVMPAWYDILGLGSERSLNEDQLLDSARKVQDLIDREIERGIDSRRIVLAGFSQGGAVNYQAGLTYPKPLAGMLALSTYFPTSHRVQVAPANESLPIEVYHGSYDPMVPELMANAAVEKLRDLGFQPGYKSYPMEHAVCAEEVRDISQFLQRILA
ncbi:carboxylesterase [Proteobacteria bacterium 005FR1]|nr:carboxylesterase [Proteobacteria bacterium 005FR1]